MPTNPTDARRITRSTSDAKTRGAPSDLSTGWRGVYAALGVTTSIESDESHAPAAEPIAPDALEVAS